MKSYAKWISVLIFTFLLGVAFSMDMLERSVDRHKSDDTDKISEVVDLTDSIPWTLSEVDEANAVYSGILAHERYISDVIIVRDRTFMSYLTPFTMTDGSIPELQIDTFKNYKATTARSAFNCYPKFRKARCNAQRKRRR